ncbi:ectopic P granules protein 5 homolog [Notechis scutatus]|uniref:Ectopic P granules protein 5 homolog n=1 Tax=Notechis scutatus TaxID=8663 RepID=A0A6J1VE06_9SAUR|nr:ectopic P granules protein 5 homolog [Notechis scutatus]
MSLALGYNGWLLLNFRLAALRESQQVAFSSEILDTLPKLYTNREEQGHLVQPPPPKQETLHHFLTLLSGFSLGRFRVLARSMSAFLLVQVPVENQIRLRSGVELQLSAKAQQALNALDSLASNKQYAEYQGQILQASQFIRDSHHCLHHGTQLLAILLNTLYAEVRYLDAIR